MNASVFEWSFLWQLLFACLHHNRTLHSHSKLALRTNRLGRLLSPLWTWQMFWFLGSVYCEFTWQPIKSIQIPNSRAASILLVFDEHSTRHDLVTLCHIVWLIDSYCISYITYIEFNFNTSMLFHRPRTAALHPNWWCSVLLDHVPSESNGFLFFCRNPTIFQEDWQSKSGLCRCATRQLVRLCWLPHGILRIPAQWLAMYSPSLLSLGF